MVERGWHVTMEQGVRGAGQAAARAVDAKEGLGGADRIVTPDIRIHRKQVAKRHDRHHARTQWRK